MSIRKSFRLIPLALALCILFTLPGCGSGPILSEIPEDGFTDTVRLKNGNIKFREIGSGGCFDYAGPILNGEWDYEFITDYLGGDIPGELTESLDFLSGTPLAPGDTLTVSLYEDGTLYSGLDFVWQLPEKYMADSMGGFDCRLTLSANRDNALSYSYSIDIKSQELAPESEYMGVEMITAYQYDSFSFDESGRQAVNIHYIAQFTANGVNYALVSDNLKERCFAEALLALVEVCAK